MVAEARKKLRNDVCAFCFNFVEKVEPITHKALRAVLNNLCLYED
jgi:hypothetical protein